MSKRRGAARNQVEARMIEYLTRRLEPRLTQMARWERVKAEVTLERLEQRHA